VQPPADCFVKVLEPTLVIAGNNELELGDILKEVLSHESRHNTVAVSQVLILPQPTSGLFSLNRRDETGAAGPAISVGCCSVLVPVNAAAGAVLA
jgi:hypothetical protein